MPDTRTLQDLIDRISDEIKTDDFTGTSPAAANVYNAVQDAVIHYQRLNLFVMDKFDHTIHTAVGIEIYPVPDDLISITELNLISGGQRYLMKEDPIQDILKYKTNFAVPDSGSLYRYSFYNTDTGNGQIMTWPAGNNTDDFFEFVYQGRIPFPATPLTSNFWTTVGEQMIRHHAKWVLYRGVIREPAAAQEAKDLEQEAFENLSIESAQKQSTNTLRATRF